MVIGSSTPNCTDVIARENGVIPNDTRLGEVQIDVIADEAKQAILTLMEERERAIWHSIGNWNADKGNIELFDLIDKQLAALTAQSPTNKGEL